MPDTQAPALAARAQALLDALADESNPMELLMGAREYAQTVRDLARAAEALAVLNAAGEARRGATGGWYVWGGEGWPDRGPWYGATLRDAAENAALAARAGGAR